MNDSKPGIDLPATHTETARPRAGIVYGLRAKGADEFRYVGQTTQHLERRLYQHVWNARKRPLTPVALWIAETGVENVEAVILASAYVLDIASSDRFERQFIRRYLDSGHRLLNETVGGHGRGTRTVAPVRVAPKSRPPVSDKTKEKIRARARERSANRTEQERTDAKQKQVEAWHARAPQERKQAGAKRLATIAARNALLTDMERQTLREERAACSRRARAAMDDKTKASAAEKMRAAHASRRSQYSHA